MQQHQMWTWRVPLLVRAMVLDRAERELKHCAAAARTLHALAARDRERRAGLSLLARHFERKAQRAARRLGRADVPQETAPDRLWRIVLVWLGSPVALRWITWQERMDLKYKGRLIAIALRLGALVETREAALDERR